MARIQRLHLRDVGPAILLCENFNSGNLTGRTTGGGLMTATSSSGELSDLDLAAWKADRMKVRYVVRSYETPIAWYVVEPQLGIPGRWYVIGRPEKSWGTTAKHIAALPYSVKNARL